MHLTYNKEEENNLLPYKEEEAIHFLKEEKSCGRKKDQFPVASILNI